jgi:glycosyltransferase involved in cell wall biosynthesis
MKNRVAILVPAYKCESMIVETLNSIQAQGPALEKVSRVVIADDGSRDGTAAVARSLWKASVPLEILDRTFNVGEYASVNNAVEYLAPLTDWFLILHADNIAKPGWLEAFLERIEVATDDIGLLGSSYDNFRDGQPPTPGENKQGLVIVKGSAQSVADTLRMDCWWHISACAIRVATYIRVGGLPKIMQLKGDWDFMLRVLADGWTIEYMPRSLMLYRDNPAGSSSITFQRHGDIWETMSVIGRYSRVMRPLALISLHSTFAWYLVRRTGASILRLNFIRLLWILPAAGCIAASLGTCLLNRAPVPVITPRRAD